MTEIKDENECRTLEEELRAFEQDWKKELAEQAGIDDVVEELAKMEITKRKWKAMKKAMSNQTTGKVQNLKS